MVKEKFETLKKAYEKLNRLLEKSEELNDNDYLEMRRDAIIKRYEFTFELCWKTIKLYLEEEGLGVFLSPKAVAKEAFRVGVIQKGDVFLDMIEDRNLSVHTYDEAIADEIYESIKTKYIFEIRKIIRFFEEYLKWNLE